MRKFQVTVNGNMYEVEVEEVGGGMPVSSASVSPVQKQVAAKPEVKTEAKPQVVEGVKVVAPMPGKIVDVKVSVGQTVKEGDLIAILEAMKMENEIFASSAGKVASVNVSVGAAVETNDVLVVLA